MGKLRVIDYGTGKYPNNVCNYLLNQDTVWRTYIPEEGNVELEKHWKRIESRLSEEMQKAIGYMFVDGYTFEEAGELLYTTGTTVRNELFKILQMMDEGGFILQSLLVWSMKQGYSKRITKEALLDAWCAGKGKSLSKNEVIQFYEMLNVGKSVTYCAKTLGRSTATLQKVYSECEWQLVGHETSAKMRSTSKA